MLAGNKSRSWRCGDHRWPPQWQLLLATMIAGAAALGAAVGLSHGVSLTTSALLLAAAIAAESIQVSGDDDLPGEGHTSPFSFSLGVHVAAVLLVGGWMAALVAALAVLIVDGVGGVSWRALLFNASVFAVSTAAGGLAFQAAGGTPGVLAIPGNLPQILALVAVIYVLNLTLVSAVVAADTGERYLVLVGGTARRQLVSVAGEVSFGVAGALFALTQPWATLTLIPLVLAVYVAHSRLAMHRRETARALETFANVVDDRDPYTADHSTRVAQYVEELARALGLPASDVIRLRWAGRLHDLGKVAVDNSILHKPGKLDPAQWDVLRSHPLLSARILRRFRFAANEANAVEHHHERYDGRGYFGATEMPLAAHFLVVADTYDAMTSDRPYRKGLAPHIALAEIEGSLGTQFHPLVGRAFVAMRRGIPMDEVLSDEERRALRSLWCASKRRPLPALTCGVRPRAVALAVAIAGCGALALGQWLIAGGLLAIVPGAVVLRWRSKRRAEQIARHLGAALAVDAPVPIRLAGFVQQLGAVSDVSWARLIGPRSAGGGRLSRASIWSQGIAPSDTAILSWLQRDGEATTVVVADGQGRQRGSTYVSFPVRDQGAGEHHLVIGLEHPPSDTVLAAIKLCGCLWLDLQPAPAHGRRLALAG